MLLTRDNTELMEKYPHEAHRLTTLSKISDDLIKEGFSEEFIMTREGLKAISTQEIFHHKDVKIIKHYRFEGETDPADMSILYALETNTGIRGTVAMGYGANSDSLFTEFINQLEELPNQNSPEGHKNFE